MGKALGSLLVLAALSAAVLFLLTGAGTAPAAPTPLSERLGPQLVGTPWLGLGAPIAFALGVLLLGRPKEPGADYATREVILASCVALAAALAASAILGVQRGWSVPTIGVLGLGAAAQTLTAVLLTIRIATAGIRSKPLFVPSVLGIVLLVLCAASVGVLGSA